ncbi:hypothetical protein DL768_010851 [Monosporascus sp. mg162]|nr:hypothetical protein DL768_010851 [Monosporascus sp. mg162]
MRDLLAIIQPRSVCRIEDKTTIAGLLADLPPTDCQHCNEVPTDASSKHRAKEHLKKLTTKRVLRRLPKLAHASLLHGKPTLCDSGLFSWVFAAVYDMPVEMAGDLEDSALGSLSLSVDSMGGVTGSWHYWGLSAEGCEAGAITSKDGSDTATVARVTEALRNRRACVLLREGRNTKPWLLVMAVGWGQHTEGGRVKEVVDCRYVGAVKVSWLWEAEGWSRYGIQEFRLGHDGTRDVVDALGLLPKVIEGGYREPLSKTPSGGGSEGEVKDRKEKEVKEDGQEEEEKEDEQQEDEGEDEGEEGDDAGASSDSEIEYYSSDSDGPARPKWL